MPPCPIPSSRSSSPEEERGRSEYRRDRSRAITFDPLPEQSVRTALILDRFSVNCGILYCANDSLLATTTCMGRSFFDFVARKDEDLVRSWIDVIKSWGVNERGQPSDGGFGFGKFTVLVHGRDSRCVAVPPAALPPPALFPLAIAFWLFGFPWLGRPLSERKRKGRPRPCILSCIMPHVGTIEAWVSSNRDQLVPSG